MNKLLNKITELVKAHNLRHEVRPSSNIQIEDHEINLSNGWHIQVGPGYAGFNQFFKDEFHFGVTLMNMHEVEQELLRIKDQLATA